MTTADDSDLPQGSMRVGVYSRMTNAFVADVTLPPGSSLILGSAPDVTVPVSAEHGINRLEIIREGAWLIFDDLTRVNMIDASGSDHVQGTPAELLAQGLSSPSPLHWSRLNLTVRPGLSVFVKHVPLEGAIAPRTRSRRPEKPRGEAESPLAAGPCPGAIYLPIVTDVGTLHGRNSIILDAIAYGLTRRTLVLMGTLKGDCCSRREITRAHALPCLFVFHEVCALRITEIDAWMHSDRSVKSENLLPEAGDLPPVQASFYEELPPVPDGPAEPRPRRIYALTYDDAIELRCSAFTVLLPTLLRDAGSVRVDPSWYETQSDVVAAELATLGRTSTLAARSDWYSDPGFQRWIAALAEPAGETP